MLDGARLVSPNRAMPLNLPNTLTLLRILLVPVVVVALVDETRHGDVIAAIAFVVAATTDGIDGYIARRRNQITDFGKLMDPIADKLLIVAALVSLVSLGRLQAWVAMVIIAREIAVTGLRGVAVEQGVIVSAKWHGKIKTTLQIAAIVALIAYNPAPLAVDLLVYAATAWTVISGVIYFVDVRNALAGAAAERGHDPAAPSEPPTAS
jgi:CDP-diacylglycerol---glycerol-3-phosphate 3-phosphatidyltransferase